MPKENQRFYAIDALRGLAIINMVLFHFLYDVFMIYGKNPSWYSQMPIHIWQQAICRTFIFVSGFVWQWGRKNNLRRGLFFNLCGGVITMITLLVIPTEAIWFGILTFMGCAVLLMIPLEKTLKRVSPYWGLAAAILLFMLFRQTPKGFIGICRLLRIKAPLWLYSIKILTPLGFPFPGFHSSDYFPILPWFFLYLCGYFSSRIFMKHDAWKRLASAKIPLLSAIGRHTIWIYLAHQPVCMLLCAVLIA